RGRSRRLRRQARDDPGCRDRRRRAMRDEPAGVDPDRLHGERPPRPRGAQRPRRAAVGARVAALTARTELRGITWDHERGRDPLLATAERFEAQTGIRVTWTARTLQEFADAPIPVLAQTYDLLVLDHPHLGEVVPTGVLVALDELLDGRFVQDQARNAV